MPFNMKTFVFLCCWILFAARNYLCHPLNNRNTRFFLYTKNNPETAQELLINNEDSIKLSNFNNSQETKILIHGWLGSYKTTLNGPLRESYLSQDVYNIISVDWERDASSILYFPAVRNVPKVGNDVAEFVDFLNEKFSLNFASLVLIGHSLGAHVAGFCGKSVKRGKLFYIVGLDPASTLQNYDKPAERLASSDAQYVETIQTDGKTRDNRKGRGFLQSIGTASFFPNWGRHQPGCNKYLCSHLRSITLYAEAIRGYSFAPIYKCQSNENIMERNGCTEVSTSVKVGDPTDIEQLPGIFYFKTNSSAPYGHL